MATNQKITLDSLIEDALPVGVLTSMNYSQAIVASHDSNVNEAGGVPKNCFLLAISTYDDVDEAILLMVKGIADLERSRDLKALREELAQDNTIATDIPTRSKLQVIGFDCKIIGSFYENPQGELSFGSDVDRVLAYSSYKVIKPIKNSLSIIASYSKNGNTFETGIDLGYVRYTETQHHEDKEAKVFVDVNDFIGKKTALFGMSRSGKALTENTLIPVPPSKKFPTGWAINKELDYNDVVYDDRGNKVKIISFTPWKKEDKTYVIDLGEKCGSINTSGNHLWLVEGSWNAHKILKGFSFNEKEEEYITSLIQKTDEGTYVTLSTLLKIAHKINIHQLNNILELSGIQEHLAYRHRNNQYIYPLREVLQFLLYYNNLYNNGNHDKIFVRKIVSSEEMYNDLKNNINILIPYSRKKIKKLKKDRKNNHVISHDIKSIQIHNLPVMDFNKKNTGYKNNKFVFDNSKYIRVNKVTIDNNSSLVRCITVDSYNSLFLVENYIPTHNSNTIKKLVQSIYEYSKDNKRPIGQIIFDPQGEYANDNVQDHGSLASMAKGNDIAIYRTQLKGTPHEKSLLLNFFDEDNMQLAWDLMLSELNNSISAGSNYITGLSYVTLEKPTRKNVPDPKKLPSLEQHYKRKRLAYYAFLKLARYNGQVSNMYINIGKDNTSIIKDLDHSGEHLSISSNNPSEVHVKTIDGAYKLFTWLISVANGVMEEEDYDEGLFGQDKKIVQILSSSWTEDFRDGELTEFVKQFEYFEKGRTGVVSAFNRVRELHSTDSSGDLRESVWNDIVEGRLVIVDLSRGSSSVGTVLSELIVNSLVNHSAELFTSGQPLVHYQIIVEEAHNLFRREGTHNDDLDPWVRMSKEAAKYGIGLVYGTQEVTGVDPQILSNTSCWVISHLSSKKETKELSNYYTFSDWEDHLRAVETKGFVRLKTESSPFIIPTQIHKFDPQEYHKPLPKRQEETLNVQEHSYNETITGIHHEDTENKTINNINSDSTMDDIDFS